MKRRVVVTGVGVVSAIGSGFERFSTALLSGASGARRLDALFGEAVERVPVQFGMRVDLPLESHALHRSVSFAALCIAQLARGMDPLSMRRSSLYCGVGIGQLLPEPEQIASGPFSIEHVARRCRDPFAPDAHERMFADAGTAYLARRFECSGPAQTFVGACAAASHACIQAYEDILAGSPIAIAGGHDSMLSPLGLYLMHELGTLTSSAVRPFDLDRDGTMIGEGACYLLFEELAHAQARGAAILAELVGHGSSLDGYHVTTPEPSGQAGVRMIRDALERAQIAPEQVDYVNAHGTATSINDPIEARIIREALAPGRPYVSSSKPQVGHLIAACGAIELAGCVAALRAQRVPPNLNLKRPDPECDIRLPDGSPAADLRYVLSNSFGFGGQNACLLLRRWEGA